MRNKASLALSAAIMLLAAWGVYAALDWPLKAKLFPLVIGIPLFCLAGAEALWTLFGRGYAGRAHDLTLSDDVPPEIARRRTAIAAGWILGFFAAILLLGFPVAVPLFVFLYLVIQGGERRIFAALFSAVVWALFYGLFDLLLHLPFPAGWLQEWLGLG
jgi:hypothetical protein